MVKIHRSFKNLAGGEILKDTLLISHVTMINPEGETI